MLFDKKFQRKFALSDQGVSNVKKGTAWTVVVNLVVMGGMGVLYLLMMQFMDTLVDGAPLPGILLFGLGTLAFVILSFITHYQQYQATYGLVYEEVKGRQEGALRASAHQQEDLLPPLRDDELPAGRVPGEHDGLGCRRGFVAPRYSV